MYVPSSVTVLVLVAEDDALEADEALVVAVAVVVAADDALDVLLFPALSFWQDTSPAMHKQSAKQSAQVRIFWIAFMRAP